MDEAYKDNLSQYGKKDQGVIVVIIYDSSDCFTIDGGILYDLVLEEIYKDKMSMTYLKDVEFESGNMVIFE